MNIYEFELIALCPNGALADRYDCTLETQRVLQCEALLTFCDTFKTQKIFQEDVADQIRREFQTKTTVIGWHFGVKITCVRE